MDVTNHTDQSSSAHSCFVFRDTANIEGFDYCVNRQLNKLTKSAMPFVRKHGASSLQLNTRLHPLQDGYR